MKKRAFLISLIILLSVLILALIVVFTYPYIKNYFNKEKKVLNQYEVLNRDKLVLKENPTNENNEIENKTIEEKEIKTQENIKKIETSTDNKVEKVTYKIKNTTEDKFFAKGSSFDDIDFNALGEYVSKEEKEYRYSIIKNLKIKTVIIDYLTQGNGISHEFYKVAYKEKMIPAKILDQLIESKEFRDLIPKKYLKKEKIITLKSGEKIEFPNQKISELLFLWCEGRLTPIQKAWQTKAIK